MNDADLEKLIIKPGRLKPKFARNVTCYEVVLDSGVTELQINPLTRDSNASWTIVGLGNERCIPVVEHSTFEVCIEVTAEDGTTKQYKLNITSLSASSAFVSSLAIKGHSLKPSFSADVHSYTCSVAATCSEVEVGAAAPDKNTSIVVGNVGENVVELNFAATRIPVKVTSPDGTNSVLYEVTVTRERFLCPLLSTQAKCAVCTSVPYSAVRVKDDTSVFCRSCFFTLTRNTDKHPITGRLLEDDCIEQDWSLESSLSGELVPCPLDCGEKIALKEMPRHVINLCPNRIQESAKEVCPACSIAVPTSEMNIHNQLFCSAKHNHKITIQPAVKPHKWEAALQQELIGDNNTDPYNEGVQAEDKYAQSLQGEGVASLSHLTSASQWYAVTIARNPKDANAHFRLGAVMESILEAREIHGLTVKDSKSSLGATDAVDTEFVSDSSMLDDIRALAQQRGYINPNTTQQLKALDEEYHYLLEQGQSERADYVQRLYAFKQKQQHAEGLGTTGFQVSEDSCFALQKYQDAATIQPNNSQYHIAIVRCLMMLRRDYEQVTQRLKVTIALNPASVEARFYLALHNMRTQSNVLTEEKCMDYLMESLLHLMCNQSTISITNPLLLEGIYALAIKQHALLSFTSTLCFHALSQVTNKNSGVYKGAYLYALRSKYTLGKSTGADINFWQRLSELVKCFLEDSNQELLVLYKDICESAFLLQPCSTAMLCNFADSMLKLLDVESGNVQASDVEKLFRSSIALEGSDMNCQEVPQLVKETEFWKKIHPAVKPAPAVTGPPPTKKAAKQPAPKPAKVPPKQLAGRGKPKPLVKSAAPPPTRYPPARTSGETSKKEESSPSKAPSVPNKNMHENRLGLARVLTRIGENESEIATLYNDVIAIEPRLHDAYIELGEMLVKNKKPLEAVALYCAYPFADQLTFDDAFLCGEIVRLLVKKKEFKDERLERFMIGLGKVLGFRAIEKYVEILDELLTYRETLKRVYAGVNNKPVDSPDLHAFFKFKCWI